jgi:hypothetical protein
MDRMQCSTLDTTSAHWNEWFARIEPSDSNRVPESDGEAKHMLDLVGRGGIDELTALDLADGVAELAFGFVRAVQDSWMSLDLAARCFAAIAPRAVGNTYSGTTWSIGIRLAACELGSGEVEAWWSCISSEAQRVAP